MRIDVFAAGPGHGGSELRVGQTDENNGNAADDECDDGAAGAGALDPLAREQDPAPADHGAEGKGDHLAAGEYLAKARVVLIGRHGDLLFFLPASTP